MTRPSKTRGKRSAAKTRKANSMGGHKKPIKNRRRISPISDVTKELQEAREQQAATAEILKVIASSPGELGPVFEAMLKNAVRICSASFGTLLLYEGDRLRRVARMAAQNVPQSYAPD